MIELQRARLLAAGKGSKAGQSALFPNGSPPVTAPSHSTHSYLPITPQPPQTPQEAAAAALKIEDRQTDRFIQRLHLQRDDSCPGDASTGPTVPTALSRRMLQRQGAGFLDSTVAAVASAAADRFLATVLQQAIACRDQRLKGADLDRVAAIQRQRHKRQYQEDADDRRRRKQDKEDKRIRYNLAAIAAAEALQQKNTGAAAKAAASAASDKVAETDASKSKKRKKTTPDTMALVNGKRKAIDFHSDDDRSYDSIDEEEEYYQKYYNANGDDESDLQSENEAEDDETMILRDLVRPLEAWDFDIMGKQGLHESIESQEAADDEASDDDDSDSLDEMDAEPQIGAGGDANSHDAASENGTVSAAGDDDAKSIGAASNASKKIKPNSPDNSNKKGAPSSRKSSPVPPSVAGSKTTTN